MAFNVSWVRTGMEVRSSDGVSLGTVTEVWCGKDPKDSSHECDEGVCSRLEVHPVSSSLLQRLMGKQGPDGPEAYYVPCSAIATVSGKRVELSADARVAAEGWTSEPFWIRKTRGQVVRPRQEATAFWHSEGNSLGSGGYGGGDGGGDGGGGF